MNVSPRFFSSSIGLKMVMAVTGIVLVGFVVVHMLGNLQVFIDPELLTVYGEKLRAIPAALWGVRLVLLLAAALHVWAALRLTNMNRAARREGYRETEHRESTFASRTMRVSGVLLLVFVIYHLAHFTWGWAVVHPQFVPGDVAHNFITAFRNPLVALLYVAAMAVLAPHLYHGTWSWMQTLGLSHPRYDPLRHRLAVAVAVIVVLGNVAMPLAVLTGLIRPKATSSPAYAETGR